MIGLTAFGAGILSFFVVHRFGRRTLLIVGHLGIAVIHVLIGYFGIVENSAGVISSVLSFMLVYDLTSGPVAWIYCTETTIDAALGICIFVLWGTVFILSIVCPILLQPDSLGPSNTFFAFAVISVISAAYCYFIMKETKGVTGKEKK